MNGLMLSYLALLKKGILGRKRQYEYFLSQEKNSAFNIIENEQKKAYLNIKKKYKEIRVHSLDSNRIGECLVRYLMAVEDSIKNDSKGILDVFVLNDCINHNTRLLKIIGRHINIIDETNLYMWEYILYNFPKVEFIKYWDEYADVSKDRLFRSNQVMNYFKLTEAEENEGRNKKAFMGLNEPFVCISSRDALYLHKVEPRKNWHYHDFRDSDINLLNLSADYLSEKGITTVRMGKYVKDNITFKNCVDYANQYYDELMDIILMRDCKFYLGDAHGLSVLPMVFNKPIAFKNTVPAFLDSWGSQPQNPQNIFIFKKYYKKNENRFLSIKEMMEIERKATYFGQNYKRMGIEIVENTADEILDLTIEMNERLDGKWVETPEDIELQKKYQSILTEWIHKEKFQENAMLHAKVCSMFLKRNPYLLKE